MKKIFLISVAFLFIIHVNAQTYVVIPDANFRAAVKVLYPSCFNASDEMDITCADIINETDLDVSNKYISSIDGIQYFSSLNYFNCENNFITSLEGLPASLKNLIAGNNKIETILGFPVNMIHIEIDKNLIVNLPAFPDKLDFFSANYNKIKSLPAFPSTLQRLFVGYNNLTAMPTFPEGMYDIACNNNQLNSIPNIPVSLAALFCGSNFLKNLPAIPEMTMVSADKNCFTAEYINSIQFGPMVSLSPNRTDCNPISQENFVVIPDLGLKVALKELYPTCFNSNNEMNILCPDILNATKMDLISKGIEDLTGIEYFSSLEHLNLNNNFISELSNLPSSLTYLDCSTNTLTNLSNLPSGLIHLDCRYNFFLTSINNLPTELEYLNCNENSVLESLPDLPLDLETLSCNKCNLTALPSLPANLIYLDCSNNYLTAFPSVNNSNARVSSTTLTLPDNLEYLNASNNCFESAPVNPNPSVLIAFVVTPNRTDCKTATGVSTSQSSILPNVYPNPATEKITIEVPAETSIRIFNSTGQLLIQKNIAKTEEVDVSSFVAGMYYYTIGDVSGKLIVK